MKKSLILILLLTTITISKADSWVRKADFPNSKDGPFSFSIGTKGYTGGGIDSSTHLTNSFWEYSQLTNTWTQKSDIGGPARYYPAGFAIGNKGYAGLGMDQSAIDLFDFWEYDTTTNIWTQKSNFPGQACMYPVSFTIGNFGYVCTGWNSPNYYQDLWRYDPSTDIWTQKTSIPGHGRWGANGFSIGNYAYVGGGQYGTDLDDFWEYNSITDSWTQKANTPGHPRQDASSFLINGKGYLGTGDTLGLHFLNDFWQYDPNLNLWIQKASFPGYGRDEATFFSIGNKGYIGLGSGGRDFWEYTPDSTEGIPELAQEIKTSLYPNPMQDKATLTILGSRKNALLNIYDINGQKVRCISTDNRQEIIIFRENLASGIYFYKLTDENKTVIDTGKLLVE